MNIEQLVEAFNESRQQSLAICEPLLAEDYCLQGAAFASPPKWHLAHTTWFFETFILKPFASEYQAFDPAYEVMFNSYYNGIGAQHPREQRGMLSRPPLPEIIRYRQTVENALLPLIQRARGEQLTVIAQRLELGIEHERQHQELFFTDIKYSLSRNPLLPAYQPNRPAHAAAPAEAHWLDYAGGLLEVGFSGDGFCFDNEQPRHRVYLEPYQLSSRLVTNGEYQQFIDAGGYENSELWLADGWAEVQAQQWQGPLHWVSQEGEQLEYTLYGLTQRVAEDPVCHISGYEAEAYARWAGARLPTEHEWEAAAAGFTAGERGLDASYYHPRNAPRGDGLQQLYGDCWQWTRSAYGPYPGFTPSAGAIGEYNGKFMSNQWVLRGSSCVTKHSQARESYRNFFYPQDRWQFSGMRLARTTPRREA